MYSSVSYTVALKTPERGSQKHACFKKASIIRREIEKWKKYYPDVRMKYYRWIRKISVLYKRLNSMFGSNRCFAGRVVKKLNI